MAAQCRGQKSVYTEGADPWDNKIGTAGLVNILMVSLDLD